MTMLDEPVSKRLQQLGVSKVSLRVPSTYFFRPPILGDLGFDDINPNIIAEVEVEWPFRERLDTPEAKHDINEIVDLLEAHAVELTVHYGRVSTAVWTETMTSTRNDGVLIQGTNRRVRVLN